MSTPVKLWHWQRGRQDKAEYWKLPLWQFKIGSCGTDGYILKFKADTLIPPHKDEVQDGAHWRLNLQWGDATFICSTIRMFRRLGRLTITLFRPDLYEHSLQVFERTTILSIGWAKFKQQ